MTTTYAGVADLVGPLSIPIRVEVHRQANASEPVPWAQTVRRRPQGIRLYVDPTFDDAALLDDWTVAHELSHLILPYLGRSEAWFSEGFASFMQFRVLEAMGRIDDGHAQQLIDRRIDRARADPLIASTPFAHAGSKLRGAGRYPTLYWGGPRTSPRSTQGCGHAISHWMRYCVSTSPAAEKISHRLRV